MWPNGSNRTGDSIGMGWNHLGVSPRGDCKSVSGGSAFGQGRDGFISKEEICVINLQEKSG